MWCQFQLWSAQQLWACYGSQVRWLATCAITSVVVSHLSWEACYYRSGMDVIYSEPHSDVTHPQFGAWFGSMFYLQLMLS